MAELKEIRKIIGLTQKELAEQSGIYIRHIQRLESGESDINNITEQSKEALERVLGITFAEMQELNLNIFTRDARDSVKSGDLTLRDLVDMNKLEKAKKISKIGEFPDTFSKNFHRIPEGLFEKLTAQEVAELVDAFYQAYSDGKNAKEAE